MLPDLLQTERLDLSPLTPDDADFIRELLNSPGWIRFIGQRNIHSGADAIAYIERINNNPAIAYRVMRLRDSGQAVGLSTLLRRDYLEHPDVGFALLPQFGGNGYSAEATTCVLATLATEKSVEKVAAITLPDNERSIRLLEKLGLRLQRTIRQNDEDLLLYEITLRET